MIASRLRLPFVLLALVLLVSSALAPRLRADARQVSTSAWTSYPGCTLPLLHTIGNSTWSIPAYGGVTQPLPFTGNIAACSLATVPAYSFARYEVVQWDPALLVPDPTTVALRSVVLTSSALYYTNGIRIPMQPPVITRAVSRVAVPPSGHGAVDLNVTYFNGIGVRYKPLSDQELPVALGYTAGPRTPLAGPHPELGMAICGGDAALQEMRLVQSQALTDVMMDSSHAQMLQGFRVPRACRLHWVELALLRAVNAYAPGELAIFDGEDVNPLLTTMGPALATASFLSAPGGSSWVSHFDFDTSLVLQPNHDYWLVVAPANIYRFGAHARTGAEGEDFDQGIRSFWTRSTTFGAWVEQTGRALSFKLIGDTITAVGVGPSVPARRALQLAASPNPARGAATLIWNGAVGAVRLEVLDARGRRVASHVAGANGAGQWTWRMAGSGGPLPSGLYFVRASDEAGHSAFARVVSVK